MSFGANLAEKTAKTKTENPDRAEAGAATLATATARF